MPAPRTQVQMLTDEGIQQRDVTVTGMDESDAPATAPELTEEQETLQSLLEQHDNSLEAEAPSSGETADNADPAATDDKPNFDAPELAEFSKQFKDVMGVDLKEAFETFNEMKQQLAATKEQQAQAAIQQTVTSLQNDWGVNEAEFGTRVDAVLKYAEKLSPALRESLDNPEGIKLIWAQIEKRGGAANVTAKTAPQQSSASGAKTFKKSELYSMMQNDPKLYNARQAEIQRAFEAGTIIDDL